MMPIHSTITEVSEKKESKKVSFAPKETERFLIATDFKEDYDKNKFLDLRKPLFKQMITSKFSREFYIRQVHIPREYGAESAPIFGNFLEPLTKTPWYCIPIIWSPLVLYNLGWAMMNMNKIGALILFSIGIFVWTLIEYCLHRFLFHLDDLTPDHSVFLTLHFLLHGVHHYLPNDRYRLVVPPAMFAILCFPFYKLTFASLPIFWSNAGFAGGILGYICYDVIHYMLHHQKVPKQIRSQKKYHLEHHYKNYELGFGVTSKFWDNIFGTYLSAASPLLIPGRQNQKN